jgi:hypothetical protein
MASSSPAPRSWRNSASSSFGFTDDMVDRLEAIGLISEIISWKLRPFVPTDASGPSILAKVVERHPLVRVAHKTAR